jgi:predicted enzyme related to lactoylglutathione lyase
MLVFQEVFYSFSVNDLEDAKKFYQETKVLVYPKQDHSPASFTVLNFKVEDLEKMIDELMDKGIDFEKYDGAIKTDSKGIHKGGEGLLVAWFKDPAGNILSLIQEK